MKSLPVISKCSCGAQPLLVHACAYVRVECKGCHRIGPKIYDTGIESKIEAINTWNNIQKANLVAV